MLGGNHVVASNHPKPWRKQANILVAYAYFYNPARLLLALVRPKSKLYLADAIWQGLGMWGLAHTISRTVGWALRLRFGRIRRKSAVPASLVPMQGINGAAADHALPGTPSIRRKTKRASSGTANEGTVATLPVLAELCS